MSIMHSHPCFGCGMYAHCTHLIDATATVCQPYTADPEAHLCDECQRRAKQIPANEQERENARAEIREALRPIPGYRRSEMVARALEGVAHTTKCPDSQAYRSYQQFARQHGVPELLRVMADVLEAQR